MENICTDNTHTKIWYITLYQSTVMNSMLYKQIGNCMDLKIEYWSESERDNMGAAKNARYKRDNNKKWWCARGNGVRYIPICELMSKPANGFIWKSIYSISVQITLETFVCWCGAAVVVCCFFPLFLPGDYIVGFFFYKQLLFCTIFLLFFLFI